MTDAASLHPFQSGAPKPATRDGMLFGPVSDFLLLGGASLFILPAFALWLGRGARHDLLQVLFFVSIVVNQPHFANSYQIFYRGFRSRTFGTSLPPLLRMRYLIAGILVPVLLVLFFIASFVRRDVGMFGMGANLMYLLVGWHYVKQGYGILNVDAVRKRRPVPGRIKNLLWLNAIACWIAAWLTVNHGAPASGHMFAVPFRSLPMPVFVFQAGVAFAVVTTLTTFVVIANEIWQKRFQPPLNGTIAYLATLYLWIAFVRIDPLFLLVTPALHSLQYLAVVWRLEINRNREKPGALLSPAVRLALFVAAGVVLGYLGFEAVPDFLDAHLAYDKAIFGPTPFLFAFAIFINVHHYFLDNVSWRGGNPDMRYLRPVDENVEMPVSTRRA